MFVHIPNSKPGTSPKPLVVVLHGCSQTAESISVQSGWNKLADQYGFYVIYPQQNLINNPSLCFNWFSNEDVKKGKGEVSSIIQMVDYVKNNYPVDDNKVFCYGVSAGGAMSVVLLSNYPEIFKGGASIAGGPFMPEYNDSQRLQLMFNPKDESPEKLGNPIKKLNPNFLGEYPSIVILQGKNDLVVNPKNSDLLVKQWTNINQTKLEYTDTIAEFANNRNITKFQFKNDSSQTKVTYYEIRLLGHAIPIDPGNAYNQGGEKGTYALDKDFFSTYYIGIDFGIIPKKED